MSEEQGGILGGIKKALNTVPVGRELGFNVGADWGLGKAFETFAAKFPEQAKWLHEWVAEHPRMAWLPLWAIGEAIGKASGKPEDHILHARIADVITAFRNVARIGVTAEHDERATGAAGHTRGSKSGLTTLELQQRLSALPPETSKPVILRIGAMDPDKRRRVLTLVTNFNADQLVNLLTMDDEVLDALLGLEEPPSPPASTTPSEDQFLAALRRAGDNLKERTEAKKEN